MSYNKNNKNGNTQNTQQSKTNSAYVQRPRECKVCIDAGKTPEECASHYVKDLSGNVTCPTLLNQKCLLCGVCGHTASYCKAMKTTTTKKSQSQPQTQTPTQQSQSKSKAMERPTCSNKYAILGMLEIQAEQVKEQLAAAFPPLEPKPQYLRPSTAGIQSTSASTTSAISTWANRLKSPPSPVSQQPEQQRRKPTKPVAIAVSWADY